MTRRHDLSERREFRAVDLQGESCRVREGRGVKSWILSIGIGSGSGGGSGVIIGCTVGTGAKGGAIVSPLSSPFRAG